MALQTDLISSSCEEGRPGFRVCRLPASLTPGGEIRWCTLSRWQTQNRAARRKPAARSCATQQPSFWSATSSRRWSGTSNSGSTPNTIRRDLPFCVAMTSKYSCNCNRDMCRRKTRGDGSVTPGTCRLSRTTSRRSTRSIQRFRE